MRIPEALGPFPALWREFATFVLSPRSFGRSRRFREADIPAPLAALLLSAAGGLILLGLYDLFVGPLVQDLTGVEFAAAPESPMSDLPPTEVIDLSFGTSFGVGIDLEEWPQRSMNAPQRVQFVVGVVGVTLSNVVPRDLSSSSLLIVVQALYILVSVLCLHPVGKLLGADGRMAAAVGFMASFYGYSFLFVSCLATSVGLATVHLAGLSGTGLVVAVVLLLAVPSVFVVVRGYVEAFSEFYSLPRARLGIATIGALAMSVIVAPAILVPGLVLAVRNQRIWELFF